MPEDYILSVSDVSKKFCRNFRKSLYYGMKDIFQEVLGSSNGEVSLRADEFWAVRNVSFQMQPGDSLAILGRNGAGKTTLLRMITGRLRMDQGEIRLKGKVAAINELGAGFNQVQTGKENIYNSASIYGLLREETDAIYDRIVEFSEVGEFIDSPVANYSSGMKARLGYAITAFLHPDLFILDEVLAVGDLLFRKKCLEHMTKYREEGRSLIMATHDLNRIQSICNRSMIMDKGQIVFEGSVLDGINYFLDSLGMTKRDLFSQEALQKVKRQVLERDSALKSEKQEKEKLQLSIESVRLKPLNGKAIESGSSAEITLQYLSNRRLSQTTWGFSIYNAENDRFVAGGFAGFEGKKYQLNKGSGQLKATITTLDIPAGNYVLRGTVIGRGGSQLAKFGTREPFRVCVAEGDVDPAISTKDLDILWE